jgi:flagellar protein FlaG
LLEGARSEQVATVNPSPPSVVAASEHSTAKQDSAPKPTPPSVSEIDAAAKQIESYLKSVGRQLEFRVDNSTGRTVTTVKDLNTGEVIRQMPSEETLRLARFLGTDSHALVDVEV